jgi:uncharacterized Zn finger protein
VLRKLLKTALQNMGGSPSYARGQAYFQEGRVKWRETDDGLRATVAGTHNYDVQLWVEDDELQYQCSCPVGQDEDFCKHCVAVALASLEENDGTAGELAAGNISGKQSSSAILRYLATLDTPALTELLVDASQHDDRLRERLLLRVGDSEGANAAVKAWKSALTRATSARRFVDWREMPTYARGIAELLDRLDDWLGDGRAVLVVEMAEYAAGRVEAAIEHCDDSNGQLGELLTRIGELHLAACKAARPDPAPLAKRLFRLELKGAWDTFADCAEKYAVVLGEQGLAAYRALANAEWARLPPLGPKQRDGTDSHSNRFRITRIMESIARQSGNVEALVSVMSRDLSRAWKFLQIAEVYKAGNMADKALQWAERGAKAFPTKTDSRLREFLIGEYLRRDRGDEALALAWAQFQDSPGVETYRKLHGVATPLDAWQAWRERALAGLSDQIDRGFAEHRRSRYARATAPDRSRLVEILLWEEDLEAAWQAAMSGACREDLWLELADRRATDRPAESLRIYQRHVLARVGETNNRAYEQAIVCVRKIKPLLLQTQGQSGFDRYIDELRTATRAKRNFIKLLNSIK